MDLQHPSEELKAVARNFFTSKDTLEIDVDVQPAGHIDEAPADDEEGYDAEVEDVPACTRNRIHNVEHGTPPVDPPAELEIDPGTLPEPADAPRNGTAEEVRDDAEVRDNVTDDRAVELIDVKPEIRIDRGIDPVPGEKQEPPIIYLTDSESDGSNPTFDDDTDGPGTAGDGKQHSNAPGEGVVEEHWREESREIAVTEELRKEAQAAVNEDIIGKTSELEELKLPPIKIKRLQADVVDRGSPAGSPYASYNLMITNWLERNKGTIRSTQTRNYPMNLPEMNPPPGLMKIELFPHQKQALQWMLHREYSRPLGGILADDQVLISYEFLDTIWN